MEFDPPAPPPIFEDWPQPSITGLFVSDSVNREIEACNVNPTLRPVDSKETYRSVFRILLVEPILLFPELADIKSTRIKTYRITGGTTDTSSRVRNCKIPLIQIR